MNSSPECPYPIILRGVVGSTAHGLNVDDGIGDRDEDLTLLSAAGVSPKTDALRAMPAAPPPDAIRSSVARVASGKVALRFPLALDEEIYGLGVDFTSMRRTGSTFQLHVDHWGGRPGRTHAPVPFYVSTRGYGVFIDSSRYVTMYVGSSVRLAAAEKPPVVDRTTNPKQWSAQPSRFSPKSKSSGAAASRSTCWGSSPAGTIMRTRPRSSGTAHGFPIRRASSIDSTASTCAPTSGSTRLSRRRPRSTPRSCRLPALTWSGTASSPTTRACGPPDFRHASA